MLELKGYGGTCIIGVAIFYFHELFGLLEQADCLETNNSIDIFALHYTYLPWIQHQLDIFHKVWDQHKMKTCSRAQQSFPVMDSRHADHT